MEFVSQDQKLEQWQLCRKTILPRTLSHGGHITQRPYYTEAILHGSHITWKPYYMEAILHSSHITHPLSRRPYNMVAI